MLANKVVKSGRTTDGTSIDSDGIIGAIRRDASAAKASSQAIIPRDKNSARP